MSNYLCFDISNLLFRTFYANKSEDDVTIAGLAHHQSLLTLQKYYNKYKPDKIIMAFDRSNWRVKYTKSTECISGKVYKAHRRKNMSVSELEKYDRFKDHLSTFEEIMTRYTSVVCLAADGLEADDLIGGFCQQYASKDNHITVISTDKDFIQLLGLTNVKLVEPAKGENRTLAEWNNSAELFMFEKLFRGDAGDNVQSAYPRIRKTRILKAWNDPIELVNIKQEDFTDHRGVTIKVNDILKENELLMDLSKQPAHIRKLIKDTITAEMKNPGTYSFFDFLQFLGKYDMKKLTGNIENFAKMLSS